MESNKSEDASAAGETGEQSLRQRAEVALSRAAYSVPAELAPEEAQRLLHELHVHQIELELQNEELRQTQQALELARARYFDLYDLAPVGYVTLSARGFVQEANFTAATLLQTPRSALTTQPFSRFVAAEDQDHYYLYFRGLETTGVPQQCELRLMRADGKLIWVRLETTVAHDVASETVLYRTVMSDISMRVQAEVALRELKDSLVVQVATQTAELRARGEHLSRMNSELTQALRLKDEFLAMMSHELRSPLNIILGITEAMVDGLYGQLDEGQRSPLTIVSQSGRHLLTILSDMLDLARMGAGQELLNQQFIDVALLCDAVYTLIAPTAAAKDLQLLQQIAPDIDGLRADEQRLMRILGNLLDNAVKFTPPGGKIGLEVSLDRAQKQIVFVVWDTGIGIAEADYKRLFHPFTQVDAGLARRYEGIGLGLALARQLVELHKGSITVQSTPGVGSRFSVNLPWLPEGAATAPPGKA